MVDAIFLDFYGTVVWEDGEAIDIICKKIHESGNAENISDIGYYWWKEFQTLCTNSYGNNFQTQRILEKISLERTIKNFSSSEDACNLSNWMFTFWVKPNIFVDSKEFFEKCKLPIHIVSNIDRADVLEAIEYHNIKPTSVFTSEDAKSYKPRKEIFEMALKETGLEPNRVLHVGDSLNSDVYGGNALGINTIWLNRNNREVPEGIISIKNLLEIFGTEFYI